MGTPKRQMAYQTIGDLKLDFPGLGEAGSDYVRDLDIDGAIATTSLHRWRCAYRREVIGSHPDGVIAVRLSASRKGRSASICLRQPAEVQPRRLGRGTALILAGANDSQEGIPAALTFECRVEVRATGGR
jgi:alpha-L-fucosidase 2